jgi:hypothetical protein
VALDLRTSGVVASGLIVVSHLESLKPILTYPVGTYWAGEPHEYPEGVYAYAQANTALVAPHNPSVAQLETTRWHSIVAAPMPHRLLLGLEWLGGRHVGIQPELAEVLCTSLDSLKRAIAHYRALHKLRSGSFGVFLLPQNPPAPVPSELVSGHCSSGATF